MEGITISSGYDTGSGNGFATISKDKNPTPKQNLKVECAFGATVPDDAKITPADVKIYFTPIIGGGSEKVSIPVYALGDDTIWYETPREKGTIEIFIPTGDAEAYAYITTSFTPIIVNGSAGIPCDYVLLDSKLYRIDASTGETIKIFSGAPFDAIAEQSWLTTSSVGVLVFATDSGIYVLNGDEVVQIRSSGIETSDYIGFNQDDDLLIYDKSGIYKYDGGTFSLISATKNLVSNSMTVFGVGQEGTIFAYGYINEVLVIAEYTVNQRVIWSYPWPDDGTIIDDAFIDLDGDVYVSWKSEDEEAAFQAVGIAKITNGTQSPATLEWKNNIDGTEYSEGSAPSGGDWVSVFGDELVGETGTSYWFPESGTYWSSVNDFFADCNHEMEGECPGYGMMSLQTRAWEENYWWMEYEPQTIKKIRLTGNGVDNSEGSLAGVSFTTDSSGIAEFPEGLPEFDGYPITLSITGDFGSIITDIEFFVGECGGSSYTDLNVDLYNNEELVANSIKTTQSTSCEWGADEFFSTILSLDGDITDTQSGQDSDGVVTSISGNTYLFDIVDGIVIFDPVSTSRTSKTAYANPLAVIER